MLNIISLTALRNKVTGPGKVVKNLIKGLDMIGYPYILNRDLNSTEKLWIHDDFFALKHLDVLKSKTKLIIGPNLYALPRALPVNLSLEKYPHIMPASWVVDFWKHFGYTGILDSWPVGIDTEEFQPSHEERSQVLIYFKQRNENELQTIQDILEKQRIPHICIRYGNYKEQDFQDALRIAKYVIWIGCSESQGIAFEEVLSCNIPILLWDTTTLRQSLFPSAAFTDEELDYTPVTSAPYFDSTCGIRVFQQDEMSDAIERMEKEFKKFSPREYVLENLSLDGQAKKFLELYEKHFSLDLEKGRKEASNTNKQFRNNFLLEKAFDIYDSPFGIRARKIIKG